MRRTRLGVLLCSLVLPLQADALEVFINGENVTGVTNVSLVNARVRIDERGNIRIDAPGYSVRRVDVPAPARPAGTGPTTAPGRPPAPLPALRGRYYLVTSQTVPGMADFDVEIFINGQSAGRSRNDGDPVLDLVNHLLRPGANEVRVVARKIARDRRRSESSAHQHRVLLGEGSEERGQITLQTNLVDYTVHAGQVGDQTAVFTIVVR